MGCSHVWSMSHDRCMRCRLSLFDLINGSPRRGSAVTVNQLRRILLKKAGGAR